MVKSKIEEWAWKLILHTKNLGQQVKKWVWTFAEDLTSAIAWVRWKLPAEAELRFSDKTDADKKISKITFGDDINENIKIIKSKIDNYNFSLQNFVEYIYKYAKASELKKYINVFVWFIEKHINDNKVSSQYKLSKSSMMQLIEKIHSSNLPKNTKEKIVVLCESKGFNKFYNQSNKSIKIATWLMLWAALMGWWAIAIKQISKNTNKAQTENWIKPWKVKEWQSLWKIAGELKKTVNHLKWKETNAIVEYLKQKNKLTSDKIKEWQKLIY